MDCEVLQQFKRYFEPTLCDFSEDALAFDAVSEVGPTGHFFWMPAYSRKVYRCILFTIFVRLEKLEAWNEAGGEWTHQRANKIWKKILERNLNLLQSNKV